MIQRSNNIEKQIIHFSLCGLFPNPVYKKMKNMSTTFNSMCLHKIRLKALFYQGKSMYVIDQSNCSL